MSGATGPVDALGLVGTTIDQVRFDACADEGGFGLIYRGYHEGLGEAVAIKCLRIFTTQRVNEAMREALAGRFRDETKLLYRLSQGNLDIVRCISSGSVVSPKTREYTPYMVLEWLDGKTLSAELKERRREKLPPRSLEEAVSLLDPAAGAIAYAHAHDVVHRDVKPGNLFLARTRAGVRMKVLDFGLAKILSDEAIGVRPSVETGVGVHFCSPSYGAPEQFSAQVGKIGPSTDVYSLTLVLLEIMVGDKVRQGGTLAQGLLKALDPKTGSPSASSLGLKLSRPVEELLLRAVAQNPLERPRDAGAFWAALKLAMAAPKVNPNAATVLAGSANEAMNQVRAATAAHSAQPAPFTGTLLMRNAPIGAPHLGPSSIGPPPAPIPAAGRPPEPVSRSTAPLKSPVPPAPPAGADAARDARQPGPELKGTLPFNAMSPLAASTAALLPLRGAHSSPPPPPQQPDLRQGTPAGFAPQAPQRQPSYHPPRGSQLPHGSQSQHAPQSPHGSQSQHGSQPPHSPQPQHGSQPPHSPQPGDRQHARTDPHAGMPESVRLPMKSSAFPIVIVVVSLVVAAVGLAFYLVRLRGH